MRRADADLALLEDMLRFAMDAAALVDGLIAAIERMLAESDA